jgi:hypothetical protein
MRYRLILIVLLAACTLCATEQRGTVKANGLPIPGATVTAVQGDIKQTTSTDEAGNYVFENLSPGRWTIAVEMFGFGKQSKEVEMLASVEPPLLDWELKLQVPVIGAVAGSAPAVASTPAAAPAPVASPATGAKQSAATPAATAPAAAGKAPESASAPAAKAGRGTQTAAAKAGRGTQTAAAAKKGQQAQQQQPGFQRTDVNQTAQEGVLAENAGQREAIQGENLEQGANESLLVTGSVSRGLEFQRGEEGFGRDFGIMMGMGGPGGPGGPGGMGMGGPGGLGMSGLPGQGEGTGDQTGATTAGGGRGAMMAGGGGPGGGGRGGGMMMGGGGGGFGGGGGRGGGPGGGGPGGGRGGPGDRGGAQGLANQRAPWQNRANVSLLGNRRFRGREGYHGQIAVDSFSDSKLDARSYSLNGQPVAKPSYVSGRYSLMVGGPLHIPKLVPYNDKTTINLSFGGTLGQQGATGVATVPSDLERTANFSQSSVRASPVAIFDPLTGLAFPNNTIPTARLNPAAAGLLQYIPRQNQPGTIQNFQRSWSNPTGGNKNFGARVMRTINAKNRLSFNYSLQNRSSHTQSLFGFIDSSSGRGQSTSASWTHNFTTRLISNFSYSFSRNQSQTLPYFAYGQNIAAQLGITGVSTDPVNYGPPTLSFTNFSGLSDTSPTISSSQTSSLSEGVTWSHGKQTISFGGGFRAMQTNSHTDSNGRGTFTFTGFASSQLDAKGQPISGTGYDFADFLLGLPQQTSIRFGASDIYMRSKAYNLYIQDDFRRFTRLSLNFGLRWEVQPPVTEKYGRMANLDIAPGYTAAVVVTPGAVGPYSGEIPAGMIHTAYNTFAPRFGLAWRPFKKHSTRVRAGYGVYFGLGTSVYNNISNRLAQQPPFAQSGTFTSSLASPLTLQNGFVGSPTTQITNTFAVDPWYRPGYAQTWNLAIQHDVTRSLMLDINYMGAKGTHLNTQTSPNVPLAGSVLNPTNQIANASTFTYQSSQSNSIYHAFQVSVNRRLGRGLSVQSRYSFSKLIDNSQSLGAGVAQDYLNLAAERAVDNAPHTFSAGYTLTSPVGDSSALIAAKGIIGTILRDWNLSGQIGLTSGAPLTATVLGNRSLSGTGVAGSLRADATGQPVRSEHGWFNLAAFAVPAAGTLGNAGRNTIPGPGSFTMNASFGRTFRLKETRRSIDFHAQASNPLNYVNIAGFGTTVNSSTYGIATRAGGMRRVTMSLRFRF